MTANAQTLPICKVESRELEENRRARTAEKHLRKSGYLLLDTITCTCHGDIVFLRGRVPSYYIKQIAK